MTASIRISWALLFVVLASACGSTRDKRSASPFAPAPDPQAPPPKEVLVLHKPWTAQFLEPAALVAAEIRIEGPVGLLEHVVTRREEEIQVVEAKTTSAGFLQIITLKPGVGAAEIRAQLDQLEISALHKLTILERPGPVDVVVIAAGDAWWRETATKKEQRASSLRLEGKVLR